MLGHCVLLGAHLSEEEHYLSAFPLDVPKAFCDELFNYTNKVTAKELFRQSAWRSPHSLTLYT